ncbi:MAG: hypothetical protein AB7H71_13860 [Alphaproteobacteria bacterium]
MLHLQEISSEGALESLAPRRFRGAEGEILQQKNSKRRPVFRYPRQRY